MKPTVGEILHNTLLDLYYATVHRLLYRPRKSCRLWHARACACPVCDDTGYAPRRWALRLGLATERRWDI